jgi:histidinol-phosphate/aromatic aminotransferase/cobyric acid decarboxylase-like protein
LINPDNPSGNLIPHEDIISLIHWAKTKKITLIIDVSFIDFSDNPTKNNLLDNDILQKNPHIAVIKSISKSYGVPGLRLGVIATSNKILLDAIKQDVAIWNINSFAEFYLQIFNKYEATYRDAIEKFREERKRFFEELQTINYLRIIPSQANYFLCEIMNRYTAKELTDLLLNNYNILIKDCGKKTAFANKNYIRIAIRKKEDNDKCLSALKEL